MALFANSITGEFQYDDAHTVEGNPYVHDVRAFFWSYFTDGRTSSLLPENSGYRPLSTLVYALCWAVGGGATWPFHLYKILAHALVAWLIFVIGAHLIRKALTAPFELYLAYPKLQRAETGGRRLAFERFAATPETIAFIGALFFLVHPGNSETVNYIGATTTSHNTLFALLAFWAFIASGEARSRAGYWARLALMCVLFFASMFMKEESATFPCLVLLYLVVFRDRALPWKEWARKSWPPVALSFATLGAALAIYFTMRPASGALSRAGVTVYQYFITEIWAWAYYLFWIFKPWGYAIEHTHIGFRDHWYEWQVLVGVVANVAIISWGLWLAFRSERGRGLAALGFGIGWYYLAILPNSSIFPLTEPINEHRYYLAYSLLFPGIAYGICHLLSKLEFLAVEWNYSGLQRTGVLLSARLRPLVTSGIFGLGVLVLSGVTFGRNFTWRTNEGMWADAVVKDPGNGRAHNNLGTVYLQRGDYQRALRSFLRCSDAWDNYKYCYLNQHIAYMGLGRLSDAKPAIERAMALDPNFVTSLWYHAKYQLDVEKNAAAAESSIRRCDSVAGGKHVPCLELMVEILKRQGKLGDAVAAVERLRSIEPGRRERTFALGMILIEAKRWDAAAVAFRELVARNPNDPQASYNLAWVETQRQDWSSARQLWQRSLELSPTSEGAWVNLRNVANRIGDKELARKCDAELQRIDPKRYPANKGGGT